MSAHLILARLRAAVRRDDGITLAELVVAMGLSTLIGALTLGLFLSINTSSANTIDRSVNAASARATVQAWAAYLRVADGTTAGSKSNRIEWFTSADVLFYADINNRDINTVSVTKPPTMMWLRLDAAGSLVEEQFPSTATAGTYPTVCRTLVRGVSQAPSYPLFQALDVRNHVLTNLGTAPAASTGCRALPMTVPSQTKSPNLTVQANLQNVAGVQIDFLVRDTHNGHPLEFRSQAALPALGGF